MGGKTGTRQKKDRHKNGTRYGLKKFIGGWVSCLKVDIVSVHVLGF